MDKFWAIIWAIIWAPFGAIKLCLLNRTPDSVLNIEHNLARALLTNEKLRKMLNRRWPYSIAICYGQREASVRNQREPFI